MKGAVARFRAHIADLSPEAIALILALGLVLGVFPVFGFPTVLCAVAAFLCRINLPAIQLVNQICSTLQYLLLIPLGRAGARVVSQDGAGSGRSGILSMPPEMPWWGGAATAYRRVWCSIWR